MKSVSVAPVVRFALFVGVVLFMATSSHAATGTSGAVSKQLAINLYCGTVSLIEGDIGLLIGLILIFIGLWSMIQGAKFVVVFPIFIMGAFMTTIPSLVLSTFNGLGALLKEENISPQSFNVETCSTTGLTLTQEQIDKGMKNSQGVPYPSRGTYTPVEPNSSGSPDDR